MIPSASFQVTVLSTMGHLFPVSSGKIFAEFCHRELMGAPIFRPEQSNRCSQLDVHAIVQCRRSFFMLVLSQHEARLFHSRSLPWGKPPVNSSATHPWYEKKWLGVSWVIGVPLVIIHFKGFSLTKTLQLWGYPHDYGNPQLDESTGSSFFPSYQSTDPIWPKSPGPVRTTGMGNGGVRPRKMVTCQRKWWM